MDLTYQNPRRHARSIIRITPVKMCDVRGCFYGYAKDISRSGISIHTARRKEAGDEIDITLVLPMTDITVSCLGRVVWRRSEGARGTCMGLEFSNIDQTVASRIDSWVKKLLKAQAHSCSEQ